jgi:hypothetical protein
MTLAIRVHWCLVAQSRYVLPPSEWLRQGVNAVRDAPQQQFELWPNMDGQAVLTVAFIRNPGLVSRGKRDSRNDKNTPCNGRECALLFGVDKMVLTGCPLRLTRQVVPCETKKQVPKSVAGVGRHLGTTVLTSHGYTYLRPRYVQYLEACPHSPAKVCTQRCLHLKLYCAGHR